MKLFTILLAPALFLQTHFSEPYVTRDIKSFGAKGDGKTNDHAAFEKAAAFFNKRGGNGKLVISKGTYIVGKQDFTAGKNNHAAYEGRDLLRLKGVRNMEIEGLKGSKIKYANGLRYGSFDPVTGKPHKPAPGYFVNYAYAAPIGYCIIFDEAENITIRNLELDGNNENFILGGSYGDVGRQLAHYGLFIQNSRKVTIDAVKAHHFGLDGICVGNKASKLKDEIKILNSAFEYNARQEFSWIGGNDLLVKNSKFNHTGQGKFASAPGAGVDIEAEFGPIRNGRFENCEFIDNKGCAMVADSGDSGDCEFVDCTFWNTDAWTVWVTKPGFTFRDCKIYGSIVHGYNAKNDSEATKYINCHFEDKPYKGKPVFGGYLVESNNATRMSFLNCTFISHTKKSVWLSNGAQEPENKYQVINCRFYMYNDNLPQNDFISVIRGLVYKNTVWEFRNKNAKKKGYYLNDCCEKYNVDAGGTKVIYAE